MTEEEWISASDFAPLSEAVERLSTRKQRLLCVALCRVLRFSRFRTDSEEILDFVEQFTDSGRSKTGLRVLRVRLRRAQQDLMASRTITDSQYFNALELGSLTVSEEPAGRAIALFQLASPFHRPARERRRQSYEVYRELAGPDGPLAFDLSWRTSTAVALAKQMYESRDFSIMPILGDALQDAGCDNDDILAHCRDPQGTHVRGCWVVDLVLEKS